MRSSGRRSINLLDERRPAASGRDNGREAAIVNDGRRVWRADKARLALQERASGKMAEWLKVESVCAGNCTVGSNPTLSASKSQKSNKAHMARTSL